VFLYPESLRQERLGLESRVPGERNETPRGERQGRGGPGGPFLPGTEYQVAISSELYSVIVLDFLVRNLCLRACAVLCTSYRKLLLRS